MWVTEHNFIIKDRLIRVGGEGEEKECIHVFYDCGADIILSKDSKIPSGEIYKSEFGEESFGDKRLAALAGYCYAGWNYNKKHITLSDRRYVNEFEEIIRECFPDSKYEERKRAKGIEVKVIGKGFEKWLNKYEISKSKKIKGLERVFNLNQEELAILLNRVFAYNGHIYYRSQMQYEIFLTVSEYFLRNVEFLLRSKFDINGRVVLSENRRWEFRCKRNPENRKFAEKIGIYGKSARILNALGLVKGKEVIPMKIQRIVDVGKQMTYYVEDSEVINGLIT